MSEQSQRFRVTDIAQGSGNYWFFVFVQNPDDADEYYAVAEYVFVKHRFSFEMVQDEHARVVATYERMSS